MSSDSVNAEPTDEERLKAFYRCRMEQAKADNALGFSFIVSILTQNYGGAVGAWLKMVAGTDDEPKSCFELLTPAQAEKELLKIYEDREEKKLNRGPK